MRKYAENPIDEIVSSSNLIRFSTSTAWSPPPKSAPQRALAPLPREVGEVLVGRREGLGEREVGQLDLAEVDRHLGPLGDPQRVVARLRVVPEQVAHLVGGLEVVLLTFELEPFRIGQHRAGLHAQQGVVGLVVLAVRVVRIVRRQQRGADPSGDLDELRIGGPLLGNAVILQLDEEVVLAEDVLEPGGLLGCPVDVAAEQ